MKTIEEFLSYLCNLDIKLWVDGERLRCNAPEGILTPSLRVQLQERKAEILAFLQKANLTSSSTLPPILPVSRSRKLPLSFAQQRLWFLQQLEPESGFYNIHVQVRCEGQLNVTALECSLNHIINRHEVLRTNVIQVDGQPMQVIAESVTITLAVVDLQHLEPTQQESICRQLILEKAAQPFDLTTDPLVRANLFKLTETEHVLLLVMHHMVSDWWSIGVLVSELAEVYQAVYNGVPIVLPELPIQYADFAHWQQQWLQGEVLARQVGYWKEQLALSPALLELPTDRPRPAVQTYGGATEKFILSQELCEDLTALSQRQGVTLFMTLLAAFQTLLYRYSGQTDICVGTPIANRNRAETEGLFGLFLNTLVIRNNLSGNPSFLELLSQVRKVALDAYAHQDLPFEQLVEQLQPERSLSHTPLFQVMLVLHNTPMQVLQLPSLKLSPLEIESPTAKFDLTLTLRNTAQGFSENTAVGLIGYIEYNTDLFDTATIARMARHYQTLLSAIVGAPEQKLSELPLLSTNEQHQLLVEWNQTFAEYPKQLCLHSLFEQQVQKTPHATAVVFEEQRLTYSELNALANQLAHYLVSLGVGAEVLVGVCVERSVEMVVGLLGILKAGGAYVPMDPEYPEERLAYMLSDSRVKVLLTQEKLVARLAQQQAHLVCLDSNWHESADASTENPRSEVLPSHLAYVIYTSGSTGKPKGAMNTHQGVCNRLLWMQQAYQITATDRILQKTPFSFDVSVWEFFWPLITGARLVVAQPGGHRDSAYLVKLIASEQITTLHFVPSMLQVFLEEPHLENGNCLRQVFCSGEALPKELVEKFFARLGCNLHNLYGPTEAAIDVTYWQCLPDSTFSSVPIGRPIANTQIYILDGDNQPVPVGVAGELHIGGDGLARGYLHRPELTAEKFIPNPFAATASDRLYKTGDLVRHLIDGNIEYLGRIDHQVKVRGFRIELGEIETVLSQHPNVRQTVVIAKEIAGDLRLVAYLVPQSNATPAMSELRDFLKQQLPEYMVPSYFVVLDAIPLTPNGKVDRRALPDPSFQLEASPDFVAPRTPIEEMLVSIWASLLQVERVGIHDNFFSLGGHSLLATQLMSRLRSTFAFELPLRSLFELPTVTALAERIAALQQQGQSQHTLPMVRVPRLAQMPVSFAQQRLWFLQQLEPESGFYNIPVAVRFQGQLHITALEQSLKEIISRHEALRTNFTQIDGQPMQVIASNRGLTLAVANLQHLEPTERETACRQLVVESAVQPFDLAADLLVRASLFQLTETEHVLLLVMHHIVTDGWSMGVLVRELAEVYQAVCNEQPIALAELPIQYADFAHWQQQWFQGELLAQQVGYWKEQLALSPALLELPTDRPRPAIQTYLGATERFALSEQLSAALVSLSQKQEVTLFMTLLAAFQTLLYRYSGQTDICVGTPIANRNHGETEELIGLFVNTLVLRGNLSGNPSFSDLLLQLREVALGAYAHQDLPFEQLVEQLQPERSLSYTPLFQVMFVLQNAPMPSLELPELTLSPLPIESSTAKFDLTLVLENTAVGLIGQIEYNTDLFDTATIARMARHYQTLLSAIVAAPEQKLSELPLLSTNEQHQLLVEWNQTFAEYPKQLCLHSLFEQQVQKTPHATAVVFEEQRLTYSELNALANQLAHYLVSLGVGPEVLVGVCVERSVEMVVGLLGILKAGGAYVPMDPEYPEERLAYMLSDSRVKVLLTQEKLVARLAQQQAHLVCLDSNWHESADASTENPRSEVLPSHLAYVIYTSGSTGKPKGAMNTHDAVCNRLLWMQQAYQITATDRILQKTPFSFDVSVWEFFWPLITGARLVVAQPGGHRDSAYLVKLIATEEITTLHFVPSMLQVFLEEPHLENGNCLRQVFCSGEALPKELVEKFFARLGCNLHNLYGPTEAAIDVTYWQCLPDSTFSSVPIGRPIANTQIYILDRDNQPVPVGVAGELHIGGVGLARGYLHRPELTAEKFIPNPFAATASDRLYKTGDLVRHLIDGNIEYLGRIDHQVKVRGFRIELGEIETVLSQHPNVRQTVVIAKEIAGDLRLVAYLVPQSNATPAMSELRDFLKQQLPEYMVPSYFVVLDAIPLTPNGKVDRRALPDPSFQLEASPDFVAPRTPIEEMLVSIWASLLQVERVGIHDNFFSLGGHSLLATQLMSRLRSTFAFELPLRSLFELPTVTALAERIAALQQQGQSQHTLPMVRVPRLAQMPVSFAQQRLWFLQQLEPESGFYNIPVAVRFQGQLHITALEQSLKEIISRHEALRTNFTQIDGQPMQVIASNRGLTLAVANLQHLEPTERETACRQLVVESAVQPFDLAADLLVRASLFQLTETEHVLLLVMHHIVTDGWSMGVLVRELAEVYQAVCNEQPIALAELPIQYADFAHWQQQWFQGELLAQQVGYWKEQLALSPALLELPTDRPRPAIQTYLGATERFALSEQLSAALVSLSQKQEVTLFMTLLAAFQTLLYRYSGQTDICVGTPIANRNHGETEELIGLFVNTLVLRGNLSGNPSFSDLLLQLREVALGAYAHQDLPFEQLVEQLQPERSLSYTPLFQVMFVLQNAPMPSLELPELTLSPLPIESSTAKFDLTLVLENTAVGLIGQIEYNTDLFDTATIARMARHYQTLLSAIVAAPEQKLSELPLLSTNEQHQLLVEWNQTFAEYPKQLCLHSLFEQQVQKTPHATAVVFEEQRLTYSELNALANQLAHHLLELGVGPEVLVAICAERSIEMLVGLLAILKAGGAYVPLDPIYPPERLAYILEDSRSSVLLTQQELVNLLPNVGGRVVYLDSYWPSAQSSSNPNSNVCAENLAYAIYTSGSTGRPKGVQISHGAVVNFLSSMSAQPGIMSEDVLVAVTTITFDIAALELFLPLSRGARLVLTRDLIADGGRSIAALGTSSATVMQGTPATWRALMQAGFVGNPQLKILCGGEALDRELAAQLLERADSLWNMYGPTETTIWSAVTPVQAGSGSVSIGRAIANTQFYILDPHLQPVPVGVAGELHIGGDGLARGYLNRPELTADKFIPNPFGDAGSRLYKTGDLVHYLIDGNIEYLGRIDNQVKVRGFRIELTEIEALLSQHPTVQQAVVIIKEIAGDKRLVAYLVPQSNATPAIGELRSFLKQQLPEYMVPSYFVVLDALPLTPNSKVDRNALPAPDQTRLEVEAYIAPRNEVERLLSAVWQEVLNTEKVGVNDNFFELGGHSLLIVQVHSKLNQKLLGNINRDISVIDLFKYPTISTLAQYLAQKQDGSASTRQKINDRASKQIQALKRQPLIKQRKKTNG